MRLRLKKANDTSFDLKYPRKYEDKLIQVIDSLPEKFQKMAFDLVPVTENRSVLKLVNYDNIEQNYDSERLQGEAVDFIEEVRKELEKQELYLITKQSTDYFQILSKEDFERIKNEKEELQRRQEERIRARSNAEQEHEDEVNEMIRAMSEEFGDLIIWNDPPVRETRGQVKPSFRYNRENPDFDDDVSIRIRDYVSNLESIYIP